jgi:hypothetical protein
VCNDVTVTVQGHEFTASEVLWFDETDRDGKPTGIRRVSFKGTCTWSRANDGIRYTRYNGGTYGGTTAEYIEPLEPGSGLLQSKLWAHAETVPADSERYARFNGVWHHDVSFSAKHVSLYGGKNPIVPVLVRELREGETSIYWAWWQQGRQEFCYVWPSKGQAEMCFPYGAQAETKRGRGYLLNVWVEPRVEDPEPEATP